MQLLSHSCTDMIAHFHEFYIFCDVFLLSSAAESPVIPARFDVMADYNFSKVNAPCYYR